MASQSAGTGDHRNKDRCLYAALPSICRAADRHDPEGISGPDAVLDNDGPGEGSCSNSNIIITATARTPDEEAACQSQVLKDHWQRQNRVCIGGKNTVEDCIRLQSPHEIRNSPCTGSGVPAAQGILLHSNGGARTPVPVFECSTLQVSCKPVPLHSRGNRDQLVLSLYA